VTGLVDFSNEATSSVVVNKDVSSLHISPIVDEYQDIKRYFERPRLVTSGSLAVIRGSLYAISVSNPVTQFWPIQASGRLNGVYGYRCSIKVSVTVAATPFQQGLVVTSFQYGASAGPIYSPGNRPKFQNMSAVTNLPHARLDLAEHTMSELIIPFMSPYEFFELANTATSGGDDYGNIATLYGLLALSQVLPYRNITTIAPPTYKVYISLHDMELFGAVPVLAGAVIPQSGLTSHMDKQSGKGKQSGGAVSKFLNKTSTLAANTAAVAGALGVPQVFGAAETVSWLAGAAAKGAASLGYSKPVDEEQVQRYWPCDTTHEFHVDQPSEDFTVSPFQSNRLAVDAQQTATSVDEMSLPFVLGQYCQTFVGNMSTGDVAGTVLYATNLCPTSFWFRTNSGRPGGNVQLPVSSPTDVNCIQPTSVCYISQMFKYWRGSLKFRFHFSKTKFHAGRLLAAFVPNTKDNITDTLLSNAVPTPEILSGLVQPFQYSNLFDLKDASEFEFVVPFVSSRPWVSTFGAVGGLSLSVVDPLIANGESSTVIDYMIEVSAGEDYELAHFVGSGLAPVVAANNANVVQYQSGLSESSAITQYTTGEKFDSLKQVIMIPTVAAATYTTNTCTLPMWYYASVLPNGNSTPLPVDVSALYTTSTQNCVARMYAFVTGGTSYNVYYKTQGTYAAISKSAYDLTTGGLPPISDPRRRYGCNRPIYHLSGRETTLHGKVPSYQKAVLVPSSCCTYDVNLTLNNKPSRSGLCNFNPCGNVLTTISPDGVTQRVIVSYAASDDAHAWGYLGPPLCWLVNGLSTYPIDTAATGTDVYN
jgi:hypothetical protein